MNGDFFISLSILSLAFFIMSVGLKFFLSLKSELDLSYLAIIIFGSYSGFILNSYYDYGIIASIGISFLLSIPFTVFILFLSSKLSEIYFVIGTLSIYILFLHIVRNLDITGGAMGISLNHQNIVGPIEVTSNLYYLNLLIAFSLILITFLQYLRKTIFYKVLVGWGEKELVLKSLGIKIQTYKFFMVLLTSFLAVSGGIFYSFYFFYISPDTFWLTLLSTILVISLLSIRLHEIGTVVISFIILFSYEYLRFARLVEQENLGYFRETVFGILVMISAIIVFKNINYGRNI